MEGNSLSIYLIVDLSSTPAGQELVHYEVHGQSRMVTLLRGWLCSGDSGRKPWRNWVQSSAPVHLPIGDLAN
jgi:hypothetical protein